MKFLEGTNYFSEDKLEMTVVGRRENFGAAGEKNGPRIYAAFGFARPAYYKIRKDRYGNEYAIVKGHRFNAA